MGFRLKAFGLHLLGSATALTLILGLLYVGWYHWPGWYLADATTVVLVMIGVDVVVGPLLTFVIANQNKPRRELKRDIGIIVAVQLVAMIYGSASLWNGRPLYYAFSQNALSLVQAYDIDDEQLKLGREKNPEFAPHWYSIPRWISAPLPEDPTARQKILAAVAQAGDDVVSMPRYYSPWDRGVPSLRNELKKVNDIKFFDGLEKKKLKARMEAKGIKTDQPNAIPLTGRGRPLLAVFDVAKMQLIGMFEAT
jgi:hypothetical protein